MALRMRFVCKKCSYAIEAWDDGNPYYIDETGAKQYAHHPDHERLSRCVGNDRPHICLSCGEEVNVDSRAQISACPKCGSYDLVDSFKLDGQRCPHCKVGMFAVDPSFFVIS
jgi:DNA-directed RNA polymerase subunit RPC12/RpoP